MRVTVQTFLWNTVVGFVTRQFPYDQCLVYEWDSIKNQIIEIETIFSENFLIFLFKMKLSINLEEKIEILMQDD